MSVIKEFKEFALKGNVVDLAVGLIIGAAFGKIVTSIVNDIIMPPIGMLIGGVDFSNLVLTIKEPIGNAAPVAIKYGVFINSVIDFTIAAFAVFLLVRAINSLKRRVVAEAPPAPTTKDCAECCMPIPVAAKRCGHCGVVVA